MESTYFDYLRGCVSQAYQDAWDDEVPYWGPIQRDVEVHPLVSTGIGDDTELIEFLKLYFSKEIVEKVESALIMTRTSYLGGQYFKRGVYGSFVKKLISDIISEGPMEVEPAPGWVDLPNLYEIADDADEWTAVKTKRKRVIPRSVSGGGEPGSSSSAPEGAHVRRPTSGGSRPGTSAGPGRGGPGRGRGGRGRGTGRGQGSGQGPANDNEAYVTLFSQLEVVSVTLPAWESPEKMLSSTKAEKAKRTKTLEKRSADFIQHPVIKEFLQTVSSYDPNMEAHQVVEVFHGTRAMSLPSFKQSGIYPKYRVNEFSQGACFYVSNSMRLAFEHPLHVHPGLGVNPVMVFSFRIQTGILHGDLPLPGGGFLKCKWFEEPDIHWATFCSDNYKEKIVNGKDSPYDVIIGPVCIPTSRTDPKLIALKRDGRFIQQIAFASRKSQDWIAGCLHYIYEEVRSGDVRSGGVLQAR